MFLVRLQLFDALVDATSRLAQIAKEADVIFTPLSLRVVVSQRFPRFVATLQMSHNCFTTYNVDDDHCSRLSLESLHDALLDCTAATSMTFHFLNIHQLLLRFEAPRHQPQLRHALVLSPPQEEDIEEIEYGKFFSIDSRDLRCVIKELPLFQDDSVCVTATDSQVKFSIASKEISFLREFGQCEIVGLEGEDETQIRIILYPRLFFINLTYDVFRVYFYKTIMNTHGVMIFPAFGLYAQYVFYFPQM